MTLDADVAADVSDAERAIAALDATASALVDTEALARLLLRAESVASSKIEGVEVGGRRLMRAAAALELGNEPTDVAATEVLGNIAGMSWAIQSITESGTITLDHLLEVHRHLLTGTRLHAHAREIRTEQTWIGGSDYNPCSAAFVPPPPELIPGLLDDLVAFCNHDDLPALAQAALAHAQFETIHPLPSQQTLPRTRNEARSASARSRVRSSCIRFFAMEPPRGEGRWMGDSADAGDSCERCARIGTTLGSIVLDRAGITSRVPQLQEGFPPRGRPAGCSMSGIEDQRRDAGGKRNQNIAGVLKYGGVE